jgi:hypothetical protein
MGRAAGAAARRCDTVQEHVDDASHVLVVDAGVRDEKPAENGGGEELEEERRVGAPR